MAANVHDKINLRGTVDAWAKYTIQAFQEQLQKKRIGFSQALFNSFTRELKMAGGDVDAVVLKFNFYGRLRDMGVGRGVKAYEVKSNKVNLIAAKRYGANVGFTRRQPKRWYNKTKTHQTLRLKELLMEKMGADIIHALEGDISGNIQIKL